MNRRSFVIFTEWKDLIFGLSEEEQLILFRRLFDVHTGEEIEQTSFSNLEFVWSFISKKLEENNDAWERKREGNSRGGKIAQERKKAASSQPKSTQVNSSQPKSTQVNSLVNVNVNANANVNANVNENANGELISLRDLNSQGKEKVKKENPRTGFDKILDSDPTISNYPELRETYIGFIQMRKAIKKPLTDRGLQLIIGKVEKLATSPEDQIAILNQSIENSWQGVFELKQNNKQTRLGRVVGGNEFTALKEQEGYTGSNIFGG